MNITFKGSCTTLVRIDYGLKYKFVSVLNRYNTIVAVSQAKFIKFQFVF